MHQVKLSIIIPCYKVDKYLSGCLDALLSQTLDGIELICINDGSPDESLSILRSYKERYGDRIVLIDKENEGVWKARMDGITAAKGEYIGFADPDDRVMAGFASKLYEAVQKNGADIACCGYERIDENGRIYSREMTGFGHTTFTIRDDHGKMLEVNTAPWNKIFKSSLLKNMPVIEHIPPALDDMVFAQLIYINAQTITFIPDILISYRMRSDSIINSISTELISPIYASMKELRTVFENKEPKMLQYIDALAFEHLGISLMYRIYGKTDEGFDDLLKTNTTFLDDNFPLWRKNKYMNLSYVLKNKGTNLKLWIVRNVYRLHLFKSFLYIYTAMIKYLKIDIKW